MLQYFDVDRYIYWTDEAKRDDITDQYIPPGDQMKRLVFRKEEEPMDRDKDATEHGADDVDEPWRAYTSSIEWEVYGNKPSWEVYQLVVKLLVIR